MVLSVCTILVILRILTAFLSPVTFLGVKFIEFAQPIRIIAKLQRARRVAPRSHLIRDMEPGFLRGTTMSPLPGPGGAMAT